MTAKKTPQTTQQFVDYRISELEETVKTNHQDLSSQIHQMDNKLDNTYASKDYVDSKHKNHEERLVSLENDRSWAIRLVVGTVILAVMGIAIAKGGIK